jgi:hypothetical protein
MGVIMRANLEGTIISELPIRGQRSVLRTIMFKMGEQWGQDFLKMHFTERAKNRYSHADRQPKYVRRKRRLAERYGRNNVVMRGGRVDLVYTGDLERSVMASRGNVRGFPTRATVTLNGPSYFKIRPKNPTHPNMAKEILTVIPAERQRLAAQAEKNMNREAQAFLKSRGGKARLRSRSR